MTESTEDGRKIRKQTNNIKLRIQDATRHNNIEDIISSSVITSKPTSLSSLIVWNITKAQEKSPALDIKEAVTLAQCRLEQVSDAVGEIHGILSDHSNERYLACALLAWQQLGHNSADSLCRFVENKRKEESILKTANEAELRAKNETRDCEPIYQTSDESTFSKALNASNNNSFLMGPVIKLPTETSIVMRMENNPCQRHQAKKPKTPDKNIMGKIEKACSMTSPCLEVLAAMDATADELRSRACMLAQREAERAELLERAEAAWKNLENGYQRRLALAEEKEEDIAKQIKKIIEDRAAYKEACAMMEQKIKMKSDKVEKDRAKLKEAEKALCERACMRLQLSEECARGDSLAAEQSCKISQLERDLLFKEEQARRKKSTLENEVESARALTHEVERALRAELNAMRDQIAEVSKQLLEEDAKIGAIKTSLEGLQQEKMELIEDLEGCKVICDGRMQKTVDELNEKREQLAILKDKVVDCRCKLPVDVAVEVKRTPSFAAMCRCAPEDRYLNSCSCTSMHTQLLTNLLADLFGGLQFELAGAVTRLPCQLLKCLEDKHNWDRTTLLKTNLTIYFDKLLAGELDIAIVTSIEKYHAKWARPTCVDAIKPPGPHDIENEGWQERAIERRAQKLATQLAEQLFEERADELTQRAKRIIERGPPPCECEPEIKATDPCHCGKTPLTPIYWHQAMRDVTQLRRQVEDLKKESLKKDDLLKMENKFAQIVKPSTARCTPERDGHMDADRRPVKKFHDRAATAGGNRTLNDRKITNAVNQSTVFPCLVENALEANVEPVLGTPVLWHQAIQDVTQLRLQIEELKKESIKKEDLKMMEDKIAEIVNRVSSSAATTSTKMDHITNDNESEDNKKEHNIQKITRPQNMTTQNVDDKIVNKRKKVDTSLPTKTRYKTKPILRTGMDKSFKSNKTNDDHIYSVNLCLCGTKQQNLKVTKEKGKLESLENSSVWKETASKDTLSPMSSSAKKAKPINASTLSRDISARTNSKESEEQSCPSNCVCFHKIPSNTSIDKLLETLTKWKCDLDASTDLCTEKSAQKTSDQSYNFSKSNMVCILGHDQNDSLKSRDSFKSGVKSQEDTILEKNNYSCDLVMKQNIGLEQSSASRSMKHFQRKSAKSTGRFRATNSEYMGTVNLEKSREKICKCNDNGAKIKNVIPFKCITSRVCSCEKFLEARKFEEQTMCANKEKCQEANTIQPTQDLRVEETKILENKSRNEQCNSLQFPENESINNPNNASARVIENCDYQIKFLGVTLADANFAMANQVIDEKNAEKYLNMNILAKSSLPKNELSKSKINKDFIQNQVSRVNLSNPVPEFSELSSDVNNNGTKWRNAKNKEKIKDDEITTVCNESKANTYEVVGCSENSKILLGNLDKQLKNMPFEVSPSLESKVAKMCEQRESLVEDLKITRHSKLTNDDRSKKSLNQVLSHECGFNLDEFKKFLSILFTNKTVNADAALDVQSFKHFKDKDESCVCCNKVRTDESRDLEDNAFHLLEEFLRKKLNEFKTLSCNTFHISQEEEEKMFTIILQKVKQLILDSTNNITCKCSFEDEQSQGSWNRAYGLLREYIKMKIKKVQCSCKEEENNDSILPNVLGKICNLIETDFERLKALCGCTPSPSSQENRKKHAKQVNFKANVPDKYNDVVILDLKNKNVALTETANNQVHKGAKKTQKVDYVSHSMTLLIPQLISSTEIKDENKKLTTSTHLFEKHEDCNQTKCNVASLNTNSNKTEIFNDNIFLLGADISDEKTSSQTCNSPYSDNTQEYPREKLSNISLCNKTTFETSSGIHEFNFEDCTNCNNIINENQKINVELIDSIEDLVDNTFANKSNTLYCSKAEQVNPSCFNKSKNQQSSTISMQSETIQNSIQFENDGLKCSNIPYIGYTINCSCDDSLGACVCQKHNISKVDIDLINNIWKKATSDKTYLKKVAYIMDNKPIENININKDMQKKANEIHLPDTLCETTSCSNKDEQLVLKKSTDSVMQSHAKTNTFEENTSLDYTIHEETLDWCECSSHYESVKQSDSRRLKSSLSIPVPLEFKDHSRNESLLNKNLKGQLNVGLPKHACDCEMVPICHIKMLVENIETKLVNSSCTCDSLIPKVCPVHSSIC